MKLYCYQRDETPFWYTLQTMFLQNSLSYLELSCELFHESHLRCPCSRNNSVYNVFVFIYYHDIVNWCWLCFCYLFRNVKNVNKWEKYYFHLVTGSSTTHRRQSSSTLLFMFSKGRISKHSCTTSKPLYMCEQWEEVC